MYVHAVLLHSLCGVSVLTLNEDRLCMRWHCGAADKRFPSLVGVPYGRGPGGRDLIDRFYQRAIRGGFLPSDAPTVDTLAQRADDALLGTITRDRCHVLRHLCQERPMIRYELRARPNPFALPIKDNRNFISRLIYKNIY